MRDTVYPMYANTHTEASGTGMQTTWFREEARTIIHEQLNCNDDDVVIFVGSGVSGALEKLQHVLGVSRPHADYAVPATDESKLPVVFHGPAEHHSNECSWRDSLATCVCIEEDEHGWPDVVQLEAELQKYTAEGRPLIVGSFNAGSNVTGIIPPVEDISVLLHKYGALACWDYAGSGAYVDINMHPKRKGGHMDACMMSPHKARPDYSSPRSSYSTSAAPQASAAAAPWSTSARPRPPTPMILKQERRPEPPAFPSASRRAWPFASRAWSGPNGSKR
mmetsp:Transcript_42921/g.115544  ORF Transcript_42921/g.115544 Transcript_42921/m.115544 type:complete len:278 (+) Transcript_42921:417-1250(+)